MRNKKRKRTGWELCVLTVCSSLPIHNTCPQSYCTRSVDIENSMFKERRLLTCWPDARCAFILRTVAARASKLLEHVTQPAFAGYVTCRQINTWVVVTGWLSTQSLSSRHLLLPPCHTVTLVPLLSCFQHSPVCNVYCSCRALWDHSQTWLIYIYLTDHWTCVRFLCIPKFC